MSLDHDFLLLDRQIDGEWELTRFIHDPRAIHLHNNLIEYMEDTLAWVSTFNPACRAPHRGLCMCGVTTIEAAGAAEANQVFRAWAELFAIGPPTLSLTGLYGWVEDDDTGSDAQLTGGYERLEFDRDKVVGVLRQLADYAAQVRSASGRLYLLHQGL